MLLMPEQVTGNPARDAIPYLLYMPSIPEVGTEPNFGVGDIAGKCVEAKTMVVKVGCVCAGREMESLMSIPQTLTIFTPYSRQHNRIDSSVTDEKAKRKKTAL